VKKVKETAVATSQASFEMLDHPGCLARRLGSTEGLVRLAQEAAEVPVEPPGSNRRWRVRLKGYRDGMLIPLEWPVIIEAYEHMSRQRVRELIGLDQRLGEDARWRAFSEASSRTGKACLARLKPMKDHRAVQRYLQAVERGEARAWHPVVYGATLAIYSMPLRQGLMHYSWIALGCRLLRLRGGTAVSHEEHRAQLEGLYEALPAALGRSLRGLPECSADV
jgi:hypothetical protein